MQRAQLPTRTSGSLDRRHQVRGFFGVRAWVESPRLYVADEEGKPIVRQSAVRRVVAERNVVYQALLYGAVLFASGVGGARIAGAASASYYSLPTALVTIVVLATLDRLADRIPPQPVIAA